MVRKEPFPEFIDYLEPFVAVVLRKLHACEADSALSLFGETSVECEIKK